MNGSDVEVDRVLGVAFAPATGLQLDEFEAVRAELLRKGLGPVWLQVAESPLPQGAEAGLEAGTLAGGGQGLRGSVGRHLDARFTADREREPDADRRTEQHQFPQFGPIRPRASRRPARA